jgi:hypothetical protein
MLAVPTNVGALQKWTPAGWPAALTPGGLLTLATRLGGKEPLSTGSAATLIIHLNNIKVFQYFEVRLIWKH